MRGTYCHCGGPQLYKGHCSLYGAGPLHPPVSASMHPYIKLSSGRDVSVTHGPSASEQSQLDAHFNRSQYTPVPSLQRPDPTYPPPPSPRRTRLPSERHPEPVSPRRMNYPPEPAVRAALVPRDLLWMFLLSFISLFSSSLILTLAGAAAFPGLSEHPSLAKHVKDGAFVLSLVCGSAVVGLLYAYIVYATRRKAKEAKAVPIIITMAITTCAFTVPAIGVAILRPKQLAEVGFAPVDGLVAGFRGLLLVFIIFLCVLVFGSIVIFVEFIYHRIRGQ